MLVKATFIYEFEPDTSELTELVDKKVIAEDITRMTLQNELDNNEIFADDFEYEVIDDNNDHKIG